MILSYQPTPDLMYVVEVSYTTFEVHKKYTTSFKTPNKRNKSHRIHQKFHHPKIDPQMSPQKCRNFLELPLLSRSL